MPHVREFPLSLVGESADLSKEKGVGLLEDPTEIGKT